MMKDSFDTQEVIIAKYNDRKELILDSSVYPKDCEYFTITTLTREEVDELMMANSNKVQALLDKFI